MFIANLDNTRRPITHIWVRAISAAESHLSRFLFFYSFWILALFYSSYILRASHKSRRHQCLLRRLATADTPSSLSSFIFIFLFLICYIYPTNYRWRLRQLLAKTSTANMSVAFHLFPLKLLFLGVTHLTPITGSFCDDSPRPTPPSSLPPFFPPLSCYYISSNICSHTPSILKYNDNMNRRSKRKSSSLYKDVHYISEDDKTIL